MVALCLGYVIFAVLLNSVGTVILQMITTFHVDMTAASTLEACKDLTIAVVSFMLAAQIPRFGLRRAMVAALLLAGGGCVMMALMHSLWAARLLFVCVGCGFALMKVSVYACVGLLAEDTAHHARLVGIAEAMFMGGVVIAAWVFAAFIDPSDPGNPTWLNVYWPMAGLCAGAAIMVAMVRMDEHDLDIGATDAPSRAFGAMLALIIRRMILVFIIAAFFYVFIEQGLGTWLPTINRHVLHLDGRIAVQAASVYAVAMVLGRLVAGLIIIRIGWFRLLLLCLAGMAVMIMLVVELALHTGHTGHTGAHSTTIATWRMMPAAAWLLPAIGFFMAPIYPTLNSVILTTLPKARQAGLVGLIVVFSALGGTAGSRLVAILFAAIPDARVLYCLLVPLAVLAVAVAVLRRGVVMSHAE